jgi:glucose-1-phosphate thymidylyltransferase
MFVEFPSIFGSTNYPKKTTLISVFCILYFLAHFLYFFDNTAIEKTKTLTPSDRGEVEIISLLEMYLKESKLSALSIHRGATWLDAGTPESLLIASNVVKSLQDRMGMSISCPEEIAWRNGWISSLQLTNTAETCQNEVYREYLYKLIGK